MGIPSAIKAAIVQASGYAAGKVYWQSQDANQPALPCIALTLGAVSQPGQDGLVSSTDLNQPAGQEIKLQVVGFRETSLLVEVFTAGSTLTDDGSDALSVAEKIRASLLLPSIRGLLTSLGVTPFDTGQVQWLPQVVSVGFRGRAVLEVRLRVPATDVSERTGYIDKVAGKVTTSGGAITGEHDTEYSAP